MAQYRRPNSGPPAWFVTLVGMALVLGGYYMVLGVRDFVRTGGLGIEASTEVAVQVAATQAVFAATNAVPTFTPFPTFTPVPECVDFVVAVDTAIVRAAPSTESPLVEVVDGGDTICTIRPVDGTDWYLIDRDPRTRRINEGYMRNDLIVPLNPSPTPTDTVTPLPTVTPVTPTVTLTPRPTRTPDPAATPPPLPTVTPPPPTLTRTPTATPVPLRNF